MRDRVRAFITSNFYLPDGEELRDDASLLDSGIVDSTGILEIIGFLEQSFDFQVEDAEMVPENLDSVDNIVAFAAQKKASAAAC